MVHPALFRPSALSAPVTGRVPLETAKRLLRGLNRWIAQDYRPERHYMRGGRTAGAKSLAAMAAAAG